MEEPMSREIFMDIWGNLEEERQKEITHRMNENFFKMIKDGLLGYEEVYTWSLNIAFTHEEPLQYVYIEGVFKIIKNEKPNDIKEIELEFKENIEDNFMNEIHSRLTLIHVSEKVNDMLDRASEMKDSKGQIYNFNILTENNNQKSNNN